MKMDAYAERSWLDSILNVHIRLDEYDLHREGGNIITAILHTVVDKVSDAFIEQHRDELLKNLSAEELSPLIQENIAKEVAKEAVRKIIS